MILKRELYYLSFVRKNWYEKTTFEVRTKVTRPITMAYFWLISIIKETNMYLLNILRYLYIVKMLCA